MVREYKIKTIDSTKGTGLIIRVRTLYACLERSLHANIMRLSLIYVLKLAASKCASTVSTPTNLSRCLARRTALASSGEIPTVPLGIRIWPSLSLAHGRVCLAL